MKTIFKLFVLMFVGLAVLSIFGGVSLWHGIFGEPGFSVSVNGEDLDIQGMSGIAPWLGLGIGLFVTGLVVCVVLPLVLLVSVGLPLLIVALVVGCVLLGVFSLGSILFSPFILVALLALWLVNRGKRRSKAAARPSGTNIAG